MTLSRLKTILDGTTFPVAYDHFPEESGVTMPYILYKETYTNNVMADSQAYVTVKHIDIILWTKTKDETSEGKLETALNTAGLPWQMTDESWEEDVQAYSRLYEVEI